MQICEKHYRNKNNFIWINILNCSMKEQYGITADCQKLQGLQAPNHDFLFNSIIW